MTIASALSGLEKRYPWGVWGVLLAILFGALSFYAEFLSEHRPQLRFEVISDASVLDVREQVGNLGITYDGVDILKAQKALRVIVVRLVNDGTEGILKTYYDDRAPFGIRVVNGTLLRAENLASSNAYLRDSLRELTLTSNSALVPPVILEVREWFTVKLLVLHAENVRPTVEPVGKIARVPEIRQVNSTEATVEPSFLTRAFSGSPGVQAVRLVAYFVGFPLLLGFISYCISTPAHALAKRRRRKHVARFKDLTELILTDADEKLFEGYVEKDVDFLHNFSAKGDPHLTQTLDEFGRFLDIKRSTWSAPARLKR